MGNFVEEKVHFALMLWDSHVTQNLYSVDKGQSMHTNCPEKGKQGLSSKCLSPGGSWRRVC